MGFFFIPFALFVIVGPSNAVDLTDGLDGLATVPVMLVALSYTLISYVVGNTIFAEYLKIPYVQNAGELSIFCGAIFGSCLGFLWYNAPPAKIFMGDTGSLSLGGSLAMVAIIVKHEIVLAIIGGLFVLETVSVIIQVLSFKLTGKRVFMMAPIHHHFEKKRLARVNRSNKILDYSNYFSINWTGYIKIAIINENIKINKRQFICNLWAWFIRCFYFQIFKKKGGKKNLHLG